MDSLPRVATVILLVLAFVLPACPATGAFSLPVGWSAATVDLVAGVPGLSDNGSQSRVQAIDESFNGKTVHVASGDLLLVQLNEPNPDQIWQFSGDETFKVVSDVVLQMYPARHDFRVKVTDPGNLRFKKVDRRDGFLIDTFHVRVVVDRAGSADKQKDKPRRSHPLRMLQSMGPARDICPF